MVNRVKAFIGKLFWRFEPIVKDKYIIAQNSFKPFEKLNPTFADDGISKAFRFDSQDCFHHEYVYSINRPVLIEPSNSYVVYNFNYIDTPTILYSNTPSL